MRQDLTEREMIYYEIGAAFQEAYSWLGEQVADEFLLSAAAWNIQRHMKPPFRIRRHLLLYWDSGWIKSTLLGRMEEILGPRLCIRLTDLTNAALRGTAEKRRFVAPTVIQYPFLIVTEMGRFTATQDKDLVQSLLIMMEEGRYSVNLAKLVNLSDRDREAAAERYGITFVTPAMFVAQTDCTVLCATYSHNYVVEHALQDRFVAVTPKKPLDGKLTKWINDHQWSIFDGIVQRFQVHMEQPPPKIGKPEIPDSFFDRIPPPSPRELSSIAAYLMARQWWGLDPNPERLGVQIATERNGQITVSSTEEDLMFKLLEEGWWSVAAIMERTGLSRSTIYSRLARVRTRKTRKGKEVHYTLTPGRDEE